MTRTRLSLVLGACLILVVAGLVGSGWWYLFGANEIESSDLVPADAIAFASIPNAAPILLGYKASQLKTVIDDPNAQPLIDLALGVIGPKNAEIFKALAPCLSGQSFIAVTKYVPGQPEQVGLIAAMHPKYGVGDFDAFITKVQATWPEEMKKATMGKGEVGGYAYQWIKGPSAANKICVLRTGGWIVTAWGEAPLQDWVERYTKKSTTPNLTTNAAYQKALSGFGNMALARLYVNSAAVQDIVSKAESQPHTVPFTVEKEAQPFLPGSQGSWFQGGKIADRYIYPSSSRPLAETGLGETVCPLETLNFASTDNRLYWGASVDWPKLVKYLETFDGYSTPEKLIAANLLNYVRTTCQKEGVDFDKDVVSTLGSEVSVQVEWGPDTTYPEIGFFTKVEKPDVLQPIVAKMVNRIRLAHIQTAVLRELNDDGRKYAVLRFIQPSIFTPTITENGPYLGLFTSQQHAVRAFNHDTRHDLFHNDDFKRQIGDKPKTASQLMFLQTPPVLDRTYRIALPYLSLASMFSKEAGELLKGKKLPDDLTWITPIGSWSCVVTPNADGETVDSISGIGNQGNLLALALATGIPMAQSMGYLSKDWSKPPPPLPDAASTPPPTPAPAPAPEPAPMTDNPASTNTAPSAPDATAPTPETPKAE